MTKAITFSFGMVEIKQKVNDRNCSLNKNLPWYEFEIIELLKVNIIDPG